MGNDSAVYPDGEAVDPKGPETGVDPPLVGGAVEALRHDEPGGEVLRSSPDLSLQ